MNYLRLLISISAFLIALSVKGGSTQNEYYQNKMIENLEASSAWIIENGISIYLKQGRDRIDRTLIDKWGVQLWVEPWVETDYYLAQFRIKARGINYDIHNLHREQVDHTFYEFWISKIAAKDWSGEESRTVFYVTSANKITGIRKILTRSEQFIESYEVDTSQIVAIPTNDLRILYIMQAWLFPENYLFTDIDEKKVVMNSNGRLSAK